MGQPSPAHVSIYDPGDMARLVATFVSTDLITPADPSSITFYISDPWTDPGSPSVPTYTFAAGSVIRVGVGAYAVDFQIPFVASAAGVWDYLARASGGVQTAQPWAFKVATSQVI